jgi:beta-lactamase regulating signal transducer with metallopeptidase domain
MSDLLAAVLELNIAMAGGVMLVMLLRRGFRRTCGPRAAYALWWIPVACMLAVAAPRPTAAISDGALSLVPRTGHETLLLTVWLLGALATLGLMVAAQARFERKARAGQAGPALVGIVFPRVVMPADSSVRWTPEELALVRAHERAHLDRGDVRVSALVALVRCLCWFNPLAHAGAARLAFDQELACDATVMARRPGRRAYARAMLKSGEPRPPSPIACGWASTALEERIDALRLGASGAGEGAMAALVVLWIAAASAAWLFQPPTARVEKAPPARITFVNMKPASVALTFSAD